LLIRKLLHNLFDERHLFCSLTTVEIDHGNLATGRRLESLTTVARATSSGDSISGMASTVMTEGPPPRGGLAREALVRWIDDTVVKEQWRLGF
jgi:hypothetical protein